MKESKKARNKRRIAAAIAVLVIVTMALSLVAPFLANAAESIENVPNPNFEAEIDCGYGGYYVPGAAMPFSVKLVNNGDDFEGRFVVTYCDSNGNVSSVEYFADISLAKGETKAFAMQIICDMANVDFIAEIRDKKGAALWRETVAASALNPSYKIIGVLSDNFDAMSAVRSMRGVAELSADDFPSNAETFSAFDAIIINDFDSKRLSPQSVSALNLWAQNGGMLVLGGGVNAQKVYGGLSQITGADRAREFAEGGVFTTQEGETITGDYADSLQKTVGDGVILAHKFDLGLEPAASSAQYAASIPTLYNEIMDGLIRDNNSYNFGSYVLRLLPEEGKGVINSLFILLGVYIILIGPAAYVILRLKDKREIIWRVVPVAAICFTLAIAAVSLKSPYRNNFLNIFSVTEFPQGSQTATTQIGGVFMSPKNKVVLDMDENITLKTEQNETRDVRAVAYSGAVAAYPESGDVSGVTKIRADGKAGIEVKTDNAYAANPFYCQKETDLGGPVNCSVTIDGDEVVFTAENNSDKAFSDATLFMGGNFYKIGALNPKAKTEKREKLKETLGYFDLGSAVFYDSPNYMSEGEIKKFIKERGYTPKEAFTIYRRKELLEYVDYTLNSGLNAKLVAFDSAQIFNGEKTVNGKTPKENCENMYVFTPTVGFGDKAYLIPDGFILPSALNAPNHIDYYENNNEVIVYSSRSGESAEFRYYLPSAPNIKSFALNFDPSFASVEVLNVKTGKYEKAESGKEITDAKSYAGPSFEHIDVRLTFIEQDAEGAVPSISVRGGEN